MLDVDDPDKEKYPLFCKADRYEVELQPGDLLFIPGKKLNILGDKFEVLDVEDPDKEKYPLFTKADRYEVELQPGDILFIPGKKLTS